jgi:hypothetical protein
VIETPVPGSSTTTSPLSREIVRSRTKIGANTVIRFGRQERDGLMQLLLIDVPGLGALENAPPTKIFACATPAIGRTLRVVEEVGGGGRAADAGDER